MKYLVLLSLFFLLLFSGCAKRQTVSDELTTEEILFEEIQEDTTEIADISFTEESEEETPIFEEEIIQETKEPKKMLGYRIQIGAFKNKTAAEQEANRARLILDKEVYIDYIIPYYKLRVGNFLSKSDAVSNLNQVLNKGFKGAFIVETTITVE
jgi:cell division protein FtsN